LFVDTKAPLGLLDRRLLLKPDFSCNLFRRREARRAARHVLRRAVAKRAAKRLLRHVLRRAVTKRAAKRLLRVYCA
jgi:hypothetical protein